ncbi:hormogonium polysaccharide biosynthesis protein HpsA [Lyngbya sp. CCY1209]|nr:hormogonium polysaccharide biosynthesis protein HpsA [Lyngbya sp. CCY1209]
MHQRKQNHQKSRSPIPLLFRQIRTFFRRATRGLMRSLSRNIRGMDRRDRKRVAGFVLPTVTMVLMVVVLLTMAIMFRSFDRAQDARYTRVSTAVLKAAEPATSRAKAKISEAMNELENDPSRVISDEELYNSFTLNSKYTFNDEEFINISYDEEAIKTAWKFPVDSDNNGKFDRYIVYGIFFQNPEIGKTRSPLHARTLPLPPLGFKPRRECAMYVGSNDNLVTEEGWVPSLGKLKRSIFVYTLAVPISQDQIDAGLGSTYEATSVNSSLNPLEYQMDWQQKPLRGVVYRDDLEITPGSAFALNGPLFTASNLIASHFGAGARLYQLSAQDSCFYQEDLSKITVAGNVINGMTGNTTFKEEVDVDLYHGINAAPITQEISQTNQSTGDSAYEAMYNGGAYQARLTALVEEQMKEDASDDPKAEVQDLKEALENQGVDPTDARRQLLERYFSKRLRKVPFAEVPEGGDALASFSLQGSGDTLRPPDAWMRPLEAVTNISLTTGQLKATEPSEQLAAGTEDELGDRILVGNNLPALYLDENGKDWVTATLELDGDQWSNETDRTRVTQNTALPSAGDLSRNGFWERAATRKPQTAISGIGGLRVITGGGIYERLNSFLPPPQWDDPTTNAVSPSLTYDDPATSAIEEFPIVWPDTMPMSPPEGGKVYDNNPSSSNPGWNSLPAPLPVAQTPTIDPNTNQYAKGDLRMRATAVYHYAQDSTDPENEDTDQQPIACVSSYYDPTNSLTAQNMETLPGGTPDGRSNNGIVYPAPSTARPGGASLNATTGLISVTGAASELGNQANMVFPDGRFANEPLRKALIKLSEGKDLDLANQAAIDANLCALDILSGTIEPDNSLIPHEAIREVTLLNGREVKANDADDPDTNVDETFTLNSPRTGNQAAKLTGRYDLALQDRQPQEIRLTQLDLNVLRGTTIDNTETSDIAGLSPEYLLPYSGIVYASRDDALPDRSYREEGDANGINEEFSKALSPSDYQLDPSRRPNGILLINGQALGRKNDVAIGDDGDPATSPEDVLKEKGLTLVSNVPVYIQGSFNVHSQEEFTQNLDEDFGNFYDRNAINPNFACRKNDPIRAQLDSDCGTGDTWRPVTIFADAATLLSENFRFGFRNEGDFELRNNAANAIVGYDLNGDGAIGTAALTEADFAPDLDHNGSNTDTNIDESNLTLPDDTTAWQADLDGNGNSGDTLKEADFAPDINKNGTPGETTYTVTETDYGFDLNGVDSNGDGTRDNDPVIEAQITAKAARWLNGFNGYNDFAINGLSSNAEFQPFATDNQGTVNPTANNKYTDGNYSNSTANQTNTGAADSTYFNNFVTPIQRRINFPEYVMEICRKPMVSACGPQDWVVGYDENGNSTNDGIDWFDTSNDWTWTNTEDFEADIKLADLPLALKPSAYPDSPKVPSPVPAGAPSIDAFGTGFDRNKLMAGTTVNPPRLDSDHRYPRRIAFLRDSKTNELILDSNDHPIPIGINNNGKLACYTSGGTNVWDWDGDSSNSVEQPCNTYGTANKPQNDAKALWFQTQNGNNKNWGYDYPLWYDDPDNPGSLSSFAPLPYQPSLVPVLQIHATNTNNSKANEPTFPVGDSAETKTRWLQRVATNEEFNLVLGAGDVPSRPNETNGGMQNLARFLENWFKPTERKTKIFGSFVQSGRSAYATAPYLSISADVTVFGENTRYRMQNAGRRIAYFMPPARNWGSDVGLFAQPPDYFTRQFARLDFDVDPENPADKQYKVMEFFRQVGADDPWVKGLLCAKDEDGNDIVSDSTGIRPDCTDYE